MQSNPEQFQAAISYSLGAIIGNNLKNQVRPSDIDLQQLALGLQDVLADQELAIPLNQAGQIVQHYFQTIQSEQAEGAVAAQRQFMEENGKREGVVTRPSGLQYEVLRAGNGPQPKATDTVVAHYEGSLLNGRVFDSSIRRGEPATFPVNALIAGWQEALQLMPVGSRWRLFVPYELGYGDQGAGSEIPPFATLVFELELIKIQ